MRRTGRPAAGDAVAPTRPLDGARPPLPSRACTAAPRREANVVDLRRPRCSPSWAKHTPVKWHQGWPFMFQGCGGSSASPSRSPRRGSSRSCRVLQAWEERETTPCIGRLLADRLGILIREHGGEASRSARRLRLRWSLGPAAGLPGSCGAATPFRPNPDGRPRPGHVSPPHSGLPYTMRIRDLGWKY
jgi:hypothetical protein